MDNAQRKHHPAGDTIQSWIWYVVRVSLSSYLCSRADPRWNASVMPPDPGYHVFYNSTAPNTFILETTKALGEAILSTKVNKTISFDVSVCSLSFASTDSQKRDYPYTNRINTYDVVAANGATWFFVPPVSFYFYLFSIYSQMVTFFIVLTEMVTEKESK